MLVNMTYIKTEPFHAKISPSQYGEATSSNKPRYANQFRLYQADNPMITTETKSTFTSIGFTIVLFSADTEGTLFRGLHRAIISKMARKNKYSICRCQLIPLPNLTSQRVKM